MAPPALRPENAIKRAEELISVGESQAALQSLYDFITARRIRWAAPASVEPIVFKFLELGVELKKGKMLKDGLHQYKKLIQGTPEGLVSVGAVARKYVDVVEIKMAAEQAKEDKKIEVDDDLEGGVTPENLLISASEEDQSVGGFNDEAITSWTKFTWEAYRSVLDLLRNNSHLEITYSGVVSRTMQFCLKHNRKNEFKRLAEMLRQHLDAANYQQNKSGSNIIDLNDSATLQRYLDQRFNQVTVSVKLELWHEAFRSVEDVYHLMKMSKAPPKKSVLAKYYENLVKIFFVSGDQLLHTTAWKKFYQIYSTNPNATEDDFKTYASTILLSALSIKLDEVPSVGYDSQQRLYRLLGLESKPTRKEVIASILESDIGSHVDPTVKQFYELLEINYNVGTIKEDLAKLLPQLESKPYFKQYVQSLRDILVRKIFVSASTAYTTVKIDELYELATLPAPFDLTYWNLERALLEAAIDDYVSFSIDYATSSITFVKDPLEVFSVAAEPERVEEEEQQEEAETEEGEEIEPAEVEAEAEVEPEQPVVTRNSYIRNRLAELSDLLHEVESFNEMSYMEKVKLARENLIKQNRDTIERIKSSAEERAKKSHEQKKKYMESAAMYAEQNAELKTQRIMEERAAMEAKLEEEAHRRLVEKKKRELENLKAAEVKKFIDEVNEKGHVYIDPNEVKGLELKQLRDLVVGQLSKGKEELEERMNFAIKKLDYTERAIRKTELPILQKEADAMRDADLVKYDAMKKKIVDAAKAEHDAKLQDHERLVQVYDDYTALKERLVSANDEKMRSIREEKQNQLEAAKKARIEEVRKQRYEEAVAKRKIDIENAARAKHQAQQDEILRKQREIEEKLARKDAQSAPIAASAPVVASGESKPMSFAEKLRAKKEAQRAAGGESPSVPSPSPAPVSSPVPAAAPVASSPAPTKSAPKTKADLDEIARKQREMEEAIEKKLSGGRSPAPTPAAQTSSASPTPTADSGKLSFAEKMKLRRAGKK
ncbi:translation initiation factor eIF3 core subunit a NDAI_0A07590 [Naumovozyma dairenensis CBS 421]|uniref:Eukaryotic translation initiation factor 3 subunit A n=1 Tax=Naumovozyma dairenensis (strain ATCC 10597 / BCRC 20456 / CBS 421 / NBRC 0211 / NRRL Y-12639) TaxID=1071378 RepID=G0W525_NAUDC|nr:hypothetical protein NDAI_0A07590 [Naumovozyma dairenensis CBS 421]CCD22913.1 hypothetical protein NDAI_0A07590 [Naumovozyma dairenensis CBS 421]